MPFIVAGPAAPKGTNTLIVSVVLLTIMPAPPPGNVTATESVLNFNKVVEAITSVSPPLGVVLESAPVNAVGSTVTDAVSFKPAPVTTIFATPGATPDTRKLKIA